MKFLTVVSFISITLLLLNNCNTTEPPILPPENKVTNTILLKVEWQDLHRINVSWNKAKADTTTEQFTYLLTQTDEQGSKTTRQFTITGTDTSYIAGEQDSLQQGKNYKFFVEAYNKENKLKDTSKTITAKTLLPTSHNITWQIDTLGQPGNFLYDVWGLDENNVYAVGFVELPSSNSSIIKWDGIEWKPFTNVGGIKYGIYGFSDASFFVVGESSNRGLVAIWNGTQWAEYRNDYFLARGDTVYPLRSVWGSNSNDVWAVGDQGTIIHWNGMEWKKVLSPTEKSFTDISGINRQNIYAITASLNYDSEIFRFDGQGWQLFGSQFPPGGRLLGTLWFDKNGTGYIGGNDIYYYNGISFKIEDINRSSFVTQIKGRNSTDVWVVGQRLRVYHFNGVSWTDFPELFGDNFQSLEGVLALTNTVFCVGELSGIGAISIIGRR